MITTVSFIASWGLGLGGWALKQLWDPAMLVSKFSTCLELVDHPTSFTPSSLRSSKGPSRTKMETALDKGRPDGG